MLRYLFLCVLCVLCGEINAAPKVESHFPTGTALIGKAVQWTIAVRHPYWETYRLQLNPCANAELSLQQQRTQERDSGLETVFVIGITPLSLAMAQVPGAQLINSAGEHIDITGEPIPIRVISGESMQLKNPSVPEFASGKSGLAWLALIAFILMASTAVGTFFLRRTPRRRLLSELDQILGDIKQGNKPELSRVIVLLRSSWLWGFEAYPLSALELQERATSPELNAMAKGIRAMEENRYSGGFQRLDRQQVRDCISAAISVVRK